MAKIYEYLVVMAMVPPRSEIAFLTLSFNDIYCSLGACECCTVTCEDIRQSCAKCITV